MVLIKIDKMSSTMLGIWSLKVIKNLKLHYLSNNQYYVYICRDKTIKMYGENNIKPVPYVYTDYLQCHCKQILMMALPAETCNQGTKECSDCDKMNMYHHHHHHHRRNFANNIGGEGGKIDHGY
jgi:hypothetical protein